MDRVVFVGIGIVGVLALSLTATAVDTGLGGVTVDLPADDPEEGPPESGSNSPGSQQAQDDDRDGETATISDSESEESRRTDGPALWQVVTTLVLVGVGGVVVVYGLTRGENASIDTEPGTEAAGVSEPEATAVSVVDPPPTNEVYRVWRALRTEVAPVSSALSPGDVASVAVEDGFDERAVERLTREFRAVRYGQAAPTERREQRARELGESLGLWEGEE